MGLEQAKRHFDLHHGGADGWITFARIENGVFRQWHFRPEEASAALSEWIGEDVYFSQNTFYRPGRRVENVRQLRALYVDVDFYMLNFSPEWVIGHMETFIFGERVPEPNLIIHSGRGFVVVWLIEPVPGKKALPLWQAVERHFAAQFRDIGGDPRATDAARVFRIAGSINSRNGAEVTVQFRHPYRYQLRQLQVDYLPELTPRKTKTRGRPRKIARLFTVHALHAARLRDLAKLVQLRGGRMTGYREIACFLYRYWSCCFLEDPEEALRQTKEFNLEFSEPLSDQEVIRATRSAEKAWKARSDKEADRIAREKGYPGAGYNLSNDKLIEWLNITEDEQRELETIISKAEKQRRNTQYQRGKRRSKGVTSRQEYIAAQKKTTSARLEQLRAALAAYPGATQRELAKILGISVSRVNMLKKLV